MVVIVGHWEYGYLLPMVEIPFWNLPLRDFEAEVDQWWMCPISGVHNGEQMRVPLFERKDYPQILDELDPSLPRVFIEPRTRRFNPVTTWLHDFEHPKDCVYIFGSAHKNPTIGNKREKDEVVSIKTINDDGVLWSNQCLVIVLYDRIMKDGSYHS